ncbi:hypothetical protein BD626DRAFT_252505 [Schizophyllum amplum]|uniref:DUF6532 domain-containing protein n=1 Tax=Schizophyllum amplum TaxID=97359 RepID=A0A550CI15_9AGAR|nr:hypothetical protein BD626DRAFT_252505 [Auriculariopsis ampla]
MLCEQMGIKLEAAESRLPTRPRKRRGESATPKFTNANLPDCCRGDSRWKNTFIPTITLRTGTMTVPWDLTARDDTLDFISSVFEQVFGHDTGEVIDHKCAVYLVTVQRQVEYRGKFGEVALDVLQEFFETTKDPEALRQNPRATKLLYPTQASRQQYVKRALNGLCCFYAHPDYDDPSESTGIFRSHFVLATLAHHYRATEGALEEALRADLDVAANEMTPPSGALALAAVAVERAFQHYTSGERAKQVQAFSEGKCRSATEVYAEKIDQVDYDTWMEIIEGHRGAGQQSASSTACPLIIACLP